MRVHRDEVKFLLKLIYPQTCYFCGKLNREPICKECLENVEYVREPRCKKCGKPIRYEETEYCEDCRRARFAFEQGRSVWLHKGPVSWSVYQFKYHNRRIYGEFYAREMWRLYEKNIRNWGIELIVPVPLHRKRRRERGYNQAEVLGKYLSKYSGIPVCSKAVERVRYTKRQKELNDKERRKNLKGAFRVSKSLKNVRRVLVIDDIYTTGNTINEVSEALQRAGVEKIWFLTISIGQGF